MYHPKDDPIFINPYIDIEEQRNEPVSYLYVHGGFKDTFEALAELNTLGIGLQTDRALEGLWNISYLFPLIGFALAAVAFFFVKIKRKKVSVYMKCNSGELTREEAEAQLVEM